MPDADGCSQLRRLAGATRREVLSLGVAAGMGLSLPALLRARQAGASTRAPAESLILIYLHGGHPQHETWDPKPLAPAEVRGELDSIAEILLSNSS